MKKFPAYVLIFFDDVEVLYVDQEQYPAVAAAYRVKNLDPFALTHQGVETFLGEQKAHADLLADALKILEVFPNCGLAHVLAAHIHLAEQNANLVLPHAAALRTYFPDRPSGYRLQGDALVELKRFPEAIEAYRLAVIKSDPALRSELYRKTGQAYLESHQYTKAYQLLEKNVDVYSPKTTRDSLFALGSAARLTGQREEAARILRYIADYKIATDDSVWADKVARELAAAENPDASRN
jgi:tetratricopeptide (TPR) repeat protein